VERGSGGPVAASGGEVAGPGGLVCYRSRAGAASAAATPRANAAKAPRFVPITVAGLNARAERIELVLPDGSAVRVPAGFDAPTLRQVLAVLRERPC